MRHFIIGVFVAASLFLILGCEVNKEVDFSSGKEMAPDLSAYFGSKPYIPDIETFMQIGWAGSPDISRDGRRVFFNTGMSGVNQLYRLTSQDWPYQLTMFPDGIDWYALSHSGDLAIIGASVGGSERSQLYLLDTYTGRLEQIMHNDSAQFGSIVWSRNDSTIYFRSNLANLKDFKLYKMNLMDRKPELVLDLTGWNGWGSISLDGSRLMYYHANSNVDNDLFAYDVATGETDLLTKHEGEVAYGGGYFSADGAKMYITSNDNERGIGLRAVLDLATKEITYMDPDAKWEVEDMIMNPDRTVMAWILNEDGYARLKLADVATGKALPVPELDGMVSGVAFSKTSRMLYTFNSPTQTTDVWSWDWQSEENTKLTHSPYAGINPDLFTDPKLIKYTSFDGLEIPAFLYLPPKYSGGPIPFILDMHGGPEGQFRPYFNRHFQYLMLNGFGILAPNVRGSEGYGKEYLAMDNYKDRLKSVKDMKAGVDWLIANGYTEKGMIGVKGGSYGGYMVMAGITEYPDLFSAAIDEVGIVNFVSFLKNTSAYRRELREAEYGPLTDSAFLESISPLNKANVIKTPLLVVHGENDPRVPIGEARQIISAIQKRAGVVDSLIYPDEGHGIAKLNNRLEFYRKMVEFFNKYLKKS